MDGWFVHEGGDDGGTLPRERSGAGGRGKETEGLEAKGER